jgi:hypothetical protein
METREHIGYFEEILQVREGTWPKMLGSRDYLVNLPSDQVGRKLGHAGERQFTLTETVTLRKGCNQVVVKASAKKPIQVISYLQRMEGRILRSTQTQEQK